MNAKKKYNCTVCDTVFMRRQSNKLLTNKYCSAKCVGEGNRRHPIGSRIILMRAYRKAWKERNHDAVRLAERKRWKRNARGKGIFPHISKEEMTVQLILSKYYKTSEIFKNTREVIKNPTTNYPLELDFYIPKDNIAFEINGFCHRLPARGGIDKLVERMRNDKIKREQCKQKGISLYTVFV